MNIINNSSIICLIMIRVLSKQNMIKLYSINVSRALGITRQSVYRTIKNLKKNDLINLNTDKSIIITKKGFEVSNEIYSKFLFFNTIFNNTNLSDKEIILESIILANIIKNKLYYILYNKCK